MIKKIYNKFILSGAERSIKAKKNILLLAILRVISVLSGFLIVPLTINYVSSSKYGIWLTINSIVGWFGILDLGLSNGFRNKFTECLVKKDYENGKGYLSSTIAINFIVISLFFIVFSFANNFINWTKILNTNPDDINEIKTTILLTTLFFCLRFIFNIMNFVLTADQRPALSNLLDTMSSVLSLFIIFILTKTIPASLINLSLSLSAVPVIILIIASLYFFKRKYRAFIPSLHYVRVKYLKGVFGLGVKFFIIQICLLLTLALNNVLLSHFFKSEVVTEYNIAFKYLSITTLIISVISAPIWSATTDAYVKNDFNWIKNSSIKYTKVLLLSILLIVIQIIFSDTFYGFWVGNSLKVRLSMSITVGIYTIIYNSNLIYTCFINGTGKINLQLIISVIGAILYIPIISIMIKVLNWGINSVVIGNILFLTPIVISSLILLNKIIKEDNLSTKIIQTEN
jgi:O-antigen/teichoic acid export membrane protein